MTADEKEKIFQNWWKHNILPTCTPYDLQIINQKTVKRAFFASFPLFDNLYDLSKRLQEWNKNHKESHIKATEAFQAAGDMIESLLDLRIRKENLFD